MISKGTCWVSSRDRGSLSGPSVSVCMLGKRGHGSCSDRETGHLRSPNPKLLVFSPPWRVEDTSLASPDGSSSSNAFLPQEEVKTGNVDFPPWTIWAVLWNALAHRCVSYRDSGSCQLTVKISTCLTTKKWRRVCGRQR